jgi:L-ascorbate metabolism protein UlaG (beta-lactamase superfamily)
MTPPSAATREVNQGQGTVIYVGNSGFLVTTGRHKVLVDGIFQAISTEYTQPVNVVELITDAGYPFANIDLILATHGHRDHFNFERVRDYLNKNTQTRFLSTSEAAEGLLMTAGLEKRVTNIRLKPGEKQEQIVNGIRVVAYSLSHGYTKPGEEYPNLGFLVEVDKIKFFHSGDMDSDVVKVRDLEKLGLPEEGIDIAFLPHWLFRSAGGYSYVLKGIPASHYIPMHYHFTMPRINRKLIRRIAPDAILFEKELDSWEMP